MFDSPFLQLPEPGDLVCDDPAYRYDSDCGPGYGRTHLRVWRCGDAEQPTWLAMITEIGDGATVTNSAAHIWSALVEEYGPELVVLEHWNAGSGSGPDHVDQMAMDKGDPTWRRIWPTPEDHPNHAEFDAWYAWQRPLLPQGRVSAAAGGDRG